MSGGDGMDPSTRVSIARCVLVHVFKSYHIQYGVHHSLAILC
jgi:hypothetical protein